MRGRGQRKRTCFIMYRHAAITALGSGHSWNTNSCANIRQINRRQRDTVHHISFEAVQMQEKKCSSKKVAPLKSDSADLSFSTHSNLGISTRDTAAATAQPRTQCFMPKRPAQHSTETLESDFLRVQISYPRTCAQNQSM